MRSTETRQQVEAALCGLQFGSIQLVVHEGQLVRIKRVERIRLTGPPEARVQHAGRPTTSKEARQVVRREA